MNPPTHPAAPTPALDIVVVEDHEQLREQLVLFLQRPGWQVRGADCGEEMDELLRTRPAQIVVLDLNLPFEDGTSIARRLRMAMPQMGIVMLTARTRPSDRTAGYESGADVYLTKPTNVQELESVILNLARRLTPPAETGLVLDMTAMALRTAAGIAVPLTVTEVQLLHHLAMAPERQLDTDYLVHRLYHDPHAPPRREHLIVMISRLRSKINESALPHKDIVRAMRGYGYRLTMPITVR